MAASVGKQLHNRMQNHTSLQRRAGMRARGGNRLANQVLNRLILRTPTPLCLAERLAEICSFLRYWAMYLILWCPHTAPNRYPWTFFNKIKQPKTAVYTY